jgi:hypothetical protein
MRFHSVVCTVHICKFVQHNARTDDSQAVFGHASMATTTAIKEDNNTDQNPPLLEGVHLVTHTSLYSPPPPNKTQLFMSHFPRMSEYIAHLRQECHNSKCVTFQEKRSAIIFYECNDDTTALQRRVLQTAL